MSTNQPPPPPGYGGQNPYGGTPYGAPPPDPYGPPPPASPYGPPQPGYGQAQPGYGYPAQAPYPGYPVPPPPPARKGPGKAIGLSVAAIVAVAVVGGVAWAVAGGSSGGDDAKYKLVAAKTVAGDYQREESANDSELGSSDRADLNELKGATGLHGLTASYRSAAHGELNLLGAWGSISDPELAVDTGLDAGVAALSDDDSVSVKPVGSPVTEHPAGLDDGAVLKCQMLQLATKSTVTAAKVPLCAWADHSTFGVILAADTLRIATGTDTAGDGAKTTAQVRHDTRVKIS
jgi:hypothetical protein